MSNTKMVSGAWVGHSSGGGGAGAGSDSGASGHCYPACGGGVGGAGGIASALGVTYVGQTTAVPGTASNAVIYYPASAYPYDRDYFYPVDFERLPSFISIDNMDPIVGDFNTVDFAELFRYYMEDLLNYYKAMGKLKDLLAAQSSDTSTTQTKAP